MVSLTYGYILPSMHISLYACRRLRATFSEQEQMLDSKPCRLPMAQSELRAFRTDVHHAGVVAPLAKVIHTQTSGKPTQGAPYIREVHTGTCLRGTGVCRTNEHRPAERGWG